MKVGVLVLAAGFSRRFGADKRLHPVDGVPLLERTLKRVVAGGLPCRVCIRAEDGAVARIAARSGVETVSCDRAEQGMGSTLAQGVAAVDEWEGAIVALGDMAWVAPETYRALAGALVAGGIVRPVMDGRGGNPVGFAREYFAELRRLSGDGGARDIVRANARNLIAVAVDDPGIFRDLDRAGG